MASDLLASAFGQELLARAQSHLDGTASPKGEKERRLSEALRIVRANAAKFDKGAEVNLDLIGSSISGYVDNLADPSRFASAVDSLYALFFRILVEFELGLSPEREPTFELATFLNYPRQHIELFSPDAQQQIRFAEQSMPVAIMKRLLGSEVLMNVRSVSEYSTAIDRRFEDWEKRLNVRHERAERLEKSLKSYEQGFNFVGLHKGFDDLSQEKGKELQKLRIAMRAAGAFSLLPIALELTYLLLNIDRFDQVKWALLASSIPALSLTVLLVYFFRLSVRAVDGAKSQLLQLDLRKTLCTFIESYSEFAKKLKDEGAEPLSKFENVVFSGIVFSDEKIPSTFDGLDQLVSLAKAVRGSP